MPALTQLAGRGALRGAIRSLRFSSNFTPSIFVDDPLGPTPPSVLGSIVRPRIELNTIAGPQVVEPWGRPAPFAWPFVLGGIALGLVWIGYRWGKRR